MEAARELFGGLKPLESYLPKTLKEFEDYANEVVGRAVAGHKDSKHFKAFLKALIKAAIEPISADETKDLETMLAGVRADKIKVRACCSQPHTGPRRLLHLSLTFGKRAEALQPCLDECGWQRAGRGAACTGGTGAVGA